MTAIALPEVDRSTVEDLRKKVPNLSELELPTLPTMQQVGKTADQTIDRLLGRSKPSMWPWIAAGIGLAAVIGAIAAYFMWFRRPTDNSTPGSWSTETPTSESGIGTTSTTGKGGESSATTGLTAAETSLTSHPYPADEA